MKEADETRRGKVALARILDDPSDRFEEVRRTLAQTKRIRAAVGSLLVEGWVGLAAGLRSIPFELLVTPPSLSTTEQMAEGGTGEGLRNALHRRRSPAAGARTRAIGEVRAAVREGLARLDQSTRTASSIRAAEEGLSEGEHKARLHLKGGLGTRVLYFDGAKQALVSSDNPLLGYMEEGDLTVVLNDEAAASVGKWFSGLWADGHGLEEVLLEELRRCWALQALSPFEAYVLVLYHLLSIGAASDDEVLLQDEPIFAQLAEFQLDAVRSALSIMRRQQGCFVSDVVGLGKSMIGCALIKYFERIEGMRALIICPAVLTDMWERYVDEYELSARVVSTGLLQDNSRLADAFERKSLELADRELILVDESHMFRNPGTQRYRFLESFIGDDRRVVLLSATPMNRTARDVYHQIRLFHQRDVTSLPITPPHLDRFFGLVDRGRAHLPDLLRHIVIRRTRRDIIRRYGRDSETERRVAPEDLSDYMTGRRKAYFMLGESRQSFPARELSTVSYSIEAAYNGIYRKLLSRIGQSGRATDEALLHTRYRRLEYVLPEYQAEYSHLSGTQGSLAALMRALLLKRLESSVHAFRATIGRMRDATVAEHRQAVAAGAGTDVVETDGLVGDGYGASESTEVREVKLRHLDRQRYAADLAHDIEALGGIRTLVSVIQPAQDAKLQELLTLLRSEELAEEKVLIFTQFAETAQYLHEHLQDAFGGKHTGLCWSQGGNRAEVLARFAPRANPHVFRRRGQTDIRILVATDVLSEGVNLQDARIVVNYDLHWNPVRLIQRLGRVDRIGSTHEDIGAYNFLPELELEQQLGLRERLANRISEIHEVIGEDGAILDPAEQLNERAMYAIYAGSPGEGIGDLESDLEGQEEDREVEAAEALLASIADDRPDWLDELLQLPPGLRACRASGGDAGVVTVLRSDTEVRLYWCARDGEPEQVPLGTVLPRLHCAEEEPSLEVPSWVGDRIEACREAMHGELVLRESSRRVGSRYPKVQRSMMSRLRELEAIEHRDEVARRIDRLIRALDQDLASATLRALRALERRGLGPEGVIRELSRIALDYGLVEHDYSALHARASQVVEVLVSLAFADG